ncbi:hypothetical protein ACFU98_45235 [Streptomyces sp. NPDC057575]
MFDFWCDSIQGGPLERIDALLADLLPPTGADDDMALVIVSL